MGRFVLIFDLLNYALKLRKVWNCAETIEANSPEEKV